MGTGITTGPYTISSGQTLSLNDPATWSIASATVQIQNNTGYTVFIQSAGAGYNVQPFTVSTIPCAGGQTLVAVVSATANVPVGSLTAVWLLPGQTGPMNDGPMTIYPKTTSTVTVTGATGVWYLTGFPTNAVSITISFLYWGMASPNSYIWLEAADPSSINTSAFLGTGTGTNTSLTFNGLILTYSSSLALWYGNASSRVGTVNTSISAGIPYLQSVTAIASN